MLEDRTLSSHAYIDDGALLSCDDTGFVQFGHKGAPYALLMPSSAIRFSSDDGRCVCELIRGGVCFHVLDDMPERSGLVLRTPSCDVTVKKAAGKVCLADEGTELSLVSGELSVQYAIDGDLSVRGGERVVISEEGAPRRSEYVHRVSAERLLYTKLHRLAR